MAHDVIESLSALVWLRWRLLLNSLRPGSRDTVERTSRVLDVLIPILLLLLFAPILLGTAALSVIGGWEMHEPGAARSTVLVLVRSLLGAILLLSLLMPALRARRLGASVSRLLLSPVSRTALHMGETAAGLTDPWLQLAIPILLMLPLGVAASGAWWAATQSLVAGLATVVTLMFASAAASHAVMLVFRKRSRGEWAVLIAFAILLLGELVFVWMLPTGDGQMEGPVRIHADSGWSESFPVWSWAIPTEAYAMVLARSSRGASSWFPIGVTLVWAIVAWRLSRALFVRLSYSPAEAGGAHSSVHRWLPAWPARWVGEGVAAVMQTHLRLYLRTLRGKLAVFGAPLPGVILGAVLHRQSSGMAHPSKSIAPMMLFSIVMLCMLYLQQVISNQFAAEAGGFTRQRLSPLSLRELLCGRFAAALTLYAATAVASLLTFWLVFPNAPATVVLTALFAGCAAFALVLPLAALLSATFPRAVDLSRLGSAGNPNSVATMIVTLAIPTAFVPVVSVIALVWWWSQAAVLTAMAAALICAAAIALGLVLLRLIEPAVATRLENLSLAAQGR